MGRHRPGQQDFHPRPDRHRFGLPRPREADLCRFCCAVMAKEFLSAMGVVKEHRAAVAFEQGRNVGHQVGHRVEIDRHRFLPVLGIQMIGRRQGTGMHRRMHPERDLPPAVMHRPAELRHRVSLGDVHRRERGSAALFLDAVVQFFQPAHRARDSDDVMRVGQCLCQCKAKTARGAGNQREGA